MEIKLTSVTGPLHCYIGLCSWRQFVYYRIWVNPFIPPSPPSIVTSKQNSSLSTNFFFITVLCYFLTLILITSKYLFLLKNSRLLGWEGKVASFTNITGKVPILLTSIAHVVDGSGSILKFIIMRQTIKEKGCQSLRGYFQLISSAVRQLTTTSSNYSGK